MKSVVGNRSVDIAWGKYPIMALLVLNVIIVSMMAGAANAENLAVIKWKHAVNSWDLLNDALQSDAQMIEADVMIGTHLRNSSNVPSIPIMSHPPKNESDLSLQEFLTRILAFNVKNGTKGVKLDFKTIEVFNESLPLLKNLWKKMTYPVWINADILPGPVDSEVIPVQADEFLTKCRGLPNATLSIGWTTKWGPNYVAGDYSDQHITDMITAFDRNQVNATKHNITFPVRAGIAAQSEQPLKKLLTHVSKTNPATLTIWSSADDAVNVTDLNKVIKSIGVDRIYVDVPDELFKQLDVSSATSLSLSHFALINAVMLIGLLFFYF